MSSPMASQPMRSEYFLKFPHDLGIHEQISYEQAVQMLSKIAQMATQIPFVWSYIDKPRPGSVYVIFLLAQHREIPNDGIMFQDQETRGVVPDGMGRNLEVAELKHGFIPGEDPVAFRVRRRYRLLKGGHHQLVLLHYAKGPEAPIIPALANRPARPYPPRPLTEPAMFVMGERTGHKVPLQGMRSGPVPGQQAHNGHPGAMGPGGPMGMHPSQQAAMLAAQSRSMDGVDARHPRQAGMPAPPQTHDDDSGDEYEHVSNRSLALARFRRNHDYMHEVFMYAAYGDRIPRDAKEPYSCFNLDELADKTSKVEKEIEDLKAKASARRATRSMAETDDMTMDSPDAQPVSAT